MQFDIDSIGQLIMVYGLKIVIAVAIFMVGKFLVKKITGVLKTLMRKSKIEETLVGFFGHIINAALLAFVVIAALNQLGIETTSIAAVLAAAGLAVGLALQGSLSNLAAGVMIILFRPFKVGDYIEAGGTEGSVEEISIFTTNFVTTDNKHVIVPNNEITSGIITNFSAKKQRRIDLTIGVGYGDDLKKAKTVLSKILEKDDRVLAKPAPSVVVAELGDSSVNFYVRPWVKTTQYWDTRFALIEAIKLGLDKEGISIPFPQRDLHIIEGNPAPIAKKTPAKSKIAT